MGSRKTPTIGLQLDDNVLAIIFRSGLTVIKEDTKNGVTS